MKRYTVSSRPVMVMTQGDRLKGSGTGKTPALPGVVDLSRRLLSVLQTHDTSQVGDPFQVFPFPHGQKTALKSMLARLHRGHRFTNCWSPFPR